MDDTTRSRAWGVLFARIVLGLLFFQGALFLIVVTVLPDGIIGWFRNDGINKARAFLGFPPKLSTFPAVALDEDIQREREQLDAPAPYKPKD